MTNIIIIILSILILILLYICVNLYTKVTKLENEYNKQLSEYDELINTSYSLFFTSYKKMLQLDKNKIIYSDPDVNFIYQNLVQIMDRIRLFILNNSNLKFEETIND